MHTEGVAEEDGTDWLVRLECRSCGLRIAAEGRPTEVAALVDRLMWSDEAAHRLERMPPYLAVLVREQAEDHARATGRRVVTYALLEEARRGGLVVDWEPEAEHRLARVPGPVRAMARIELERTAAERGESRVTVALMEEVKARYFGMFVRSDEA
jgi:hypothetical protein